MSIPADLKYTPSHEWVRVEADGTLTVGITHHAQDLLGDMVFIENPAAGRSLNKGEECAVVESVKAASDVYAPVAGEVIAANAEVESSPEAINKDAYSAWMFKLKPADAADVASLMDAAAYQKLVESEAH
ncbi:MAG TPA: glycine cleavage system protein GcvH [Thiobacillus sp.]|nr:MAG: glycine cleavage system protein H [Hydrogenophilales bacterium 28-61-11]OYZ56191.1 MAG: glycine cleavage system protein H [Hydrogenophilales bacterium 16-61-112]OZA42737.1 MAG: glycine cleavage system protein H [Hydrogenophilales bacterium 17-61-76]HQT31785.1 glycine cleavage system protein GcvH [Thiobacillus sp.]HQT71144.1 glycine cleavage system protein GcvH [Thiobacillus sp.]